MVNSSPLLMFILTGLVKFLLWMESFFPNQGKPFGNFVGNICVTSPLSWKAAYLCSAERFIWLKGIGAGFEYLSAMALISPVFSEELWSLQIEFYMVRECCYSEEAITNNEQLCHFYTSGGLVDWI